MSLSLVGVPALLVACSTDGTDVPEAATSQPAPAGETSPTDAPVPQAQPSPASDVQLAPTPECGDDDDVTPPQIEGPYFTPNSPERVSLREPGISGTRLVLTGSVLTTACQPVARALVDFWQCDGNGIYDNSGYRLRGHQFTDSNGRYRLETIVPGIYTGRTRHIHVKVQAPNRPILTTQLYFPDEPANRTDRIFDPDLVIEMRDAEGGKDGSFNFVLDL
jgi:protocatechuate 3,4-dioxygenase beta subunit